MNREIKFRAEYQDCQYIVYTRKPKRKGAKGWHKCQGYIRRLVSNHPLADKRGYYPEHRLIMEQSLHRILEPTEFVHHIDQNRENNDLSNLELQGSQAKHMGSNQHLQGKRNPHGQFVANEPIFSELKFRLFNKNTKTTRIYTLATLIGTTFRRGQFEFRGRWTGLKDKNGKEIYEGDLLKWSHSEHLLEVRWGRVGWVLFSKLFNNFGQQNEADCNEVNTFGYTENSEVIGNIYENENLLLKK